MTRTACVIAHATVETPLGDMRLAISRNGLCGAWFTSGQPDCPDANSWGKEDGNHPLIVQAASEIGEYFQKRRSIFSVPIDISAGTEFQKSVWQILLAIPFGALCSYRQIADAVGNPKAARAVGAAVGANPVSILIPCHRVIGSNRGLTGYAGGMQRKMALLTLEGHAFNNGLFI